MADEVRDAEAGSARFRETLGALQTQVAKSIVGQKAVIEDVLVALLGGGHVLVEGVPGLGKTKLVRSLAESLDAKFSRIQFTPDLMPADIVGTDMIDERGGERSFRFEPGPVFTNVLLADEINRATPKTQSALLEAMQEGTVTAGGETRPLPEPFFVMATQNPIEMEGTYPLPEAQLDRFLLKLKINMPPLEDIVEILDRTTGGGGGGAEAAVDVDAINDMRKLVRDVPASAPVREYAARLIAASHPSSDLATTMVKEVVRHGASPRGAQALVLAGKVRALMDGRFNLSFDDVRRSAPSALRHRLILNFEGEVRGADTDAVVEDLIASVSPPGE